jgi:uncharacterized repeat protein (TIGR01451 family)
MKRARGRLMVACLVVAASAVAIAGGSAGNRVATPTLEAVPGPGAVSYGQNIAYTATFSNDGNSTFTHTTFTMPPPVITATGETTTFVKASCGSLDSAGALTCDFGSLNAGGSVRLTVVWNVPAGDSKPGCTGTNCLVASSTWQIKENKATNSNETFTQTANADLIGTSPTEPVSNQLRAGGYEIAPCAAGSPSLSTSQSVSKTNPVATSFCLPSFTTNATDLGLATTITETAGSARTSEVCVAALGQNCPGGSRADFGPTGGVISFKFLVSADALPKKYEITKVFHDGHEVTAATCAADNECVTSIKLDRKTNVWTILTTAETNGSWDW